MSALLPRLFSGHPKLQRAAFAVLVGVSIVMPIWALYLAQILPPKQVADNWDVVWVGLDLGMAVLAALVLIAVRRHSPWTPVLAGALAAALTCDAWFDVMTSRGGDRLFAIGLALFVELPIAAIAATIGVRAGRLSGPAG